MRSLPERPRTEHCAPLRSVRSAILFAFAFAVSSLAHAVDMCGVRGDWATGGPAYLERTTFVGADPQPPVAGRSFTLYAGSVAWIPEGTSHATVSGDTIDFDISGYFIGFDPPPPTGCGAVTLTLPEGGYTVNVYRADSRDPGQRNFVGSAVLEIASSIPVDELSVIPGAPQPGQSVAIQVPGLACYNSQPVPRMDAVNVNAGATTIDIEARQDGWSCFAAGDPLVDKSYQVDVGVLPAGAYCVNYTRRMGGAVNMTRQFAFAVGVPFSAEAACGSMLAASTTMWELAIVSTASNTVRARVPLPAGADPAYGSEIGADGRIAYQVIPVGPVSPGLGVPGRALLVIDVSSAAIIKQIALPEFSEGLVVAPDGRTAYVGLTKVSLVDGTVGKSLGKRIGPPSNVFLSPGGKRLYVYDGAGMRVYDAATMAQEDFHSAAGSIAAMHPDGRSFVFVTTYPLTATVSRFSLEERRVTGSVAVPTTTDVSHIAIHPNGDKAYLLYRPEQAVAVVDLAKPSYEGAFPIYKPGDGIVTPTAMTVAPDGRRLLIQVGAGAPKTISIDTQTHALSSIPGVGGIFGNRFVAPRRASLTHAVEYFHAGFEHYFVTSNPVEIEKLDAGDFQGWRRTGKGFKVSAIRDAGTVPVVRYFSDAFTPRSTHFYTMRAPGFEHWLEPSWQYEGEPFYMTPPSFDGACPSATVPIYRYYNKSKGGAPNHRFVADRSVHEEMLAAGWIAEGFGSGVAMCAPA